MVTLHILLHLWSSHIVGYLKRDTYANTDIHPQCHALSRPLLKHSIDSNTPMGSKPTILHNNDGGYSIGAYVDINQHFSN